MQLLRTIDGYSGGVPLRLIVEGFPSPRGRTMAEKMGWASRHADHVRQALMLEPRGHADMCGAVLTEPVAPGSHAGVLFMHGGGFAPALDHGIVTLSTLAIEHGLIVPGGDGRRIVFDTLAGTVRAQVDFEDGPGDGVRVTSVTCTLPPSFVVRGGITVRTSGRAVPADLAFGGACYAVVDSEAAGVGLTAEHVPGIRRIGAALLSVINEEMRVVHPVEPSIQGVQGVVFTGPAVAGGADLRAVPMFGDRQIAASPTEAATAAIVVVLDAIGLLPDAASVGVDGLTGVVWKGRIAARTRVGEHEAVVPEVQGSAWLTGEHVFTIRPDDPLREGFRL
jgi:proline racemase